MPARNPREVFLMLLSNVRNNTERATNAYQEFGKHAEDAEIKEALEARAFASNQILAELDECFRIIGEKPAKTSGQLQETFGPLRRAQGEVRLWRTGRNFARLRGHHPQVPGSEFPAVVIPIATLALHK